MKRGVLIILAVVILSSIALADTVVLTDPESISENDVTLECAGSVDAGTLTKAEFWANTGGSWARIATKSSVLGKTSDTVTETVNDLSNGDYEWNCVFYNNTANDAYNFTASTNGTFTINYDANTAPQFSGTIPQQSFPEDTTNSNAFDLDDYFTDTDALTYSVSGNSTITVTISSGQVSFSSTSNWTGYETMTFTASDGSKSNTSNSVIINVTAVDDEPYLSSRFGNYSWLVNTNKTIDMGDHFSDVDTTTLGYTASNPSHITVYISGDEATLVPEEDWVGNTTIIFYANDSKNKTAGNEVSLNVKSNTSSNTAPIIESYMPMIDTVKMKTTQSRTFDIVKSDADGDTLTVKWQKDGVNISGATGDIYKLENPEAGNFTLKVIVSDGGLTTSQSWNLEVRSDMFAGSGEISEPGERPAPEDVPSLLTEASEQEDLCGDGIAGTTENCGNCIEDVPCASNEICDNGECVKKTGYGILFSIILGIIAVIAAVVFLIYKLNTSKQDINDHRGGIRPGEKVKLDKLDIEPVSEVDDFYEKHGVKDIVAPQIEESKLEIFVKDMRKAGKTEGEIAEKLKQKGWPQWQIDIALKKIK